MPGKNFKSALTPEEVFQKIYRPGQSFFLSGGNQTTSLNQKIIMGVGQPFSCSYLEFKNWLQKKWETVQVSEFGFLLQLDYEAIYEMEPRLSKFKTSNSASPTVFGIWPEMLLTFNIETQTYCLIAQSTPQMSALIHSLSTEKQGFPQTYPQVILSDFQAISTKNEFINAIHRIKQYISAGDIFQCNFSQGFEGQVGDGGFVHTLDSSSVPRYFDLFKKLTILNPSPFGAYVEMDSRVLVSNSPERLFEVDQNGLIQTRPIAGTYPRGRRHSELLLNPKEKAEHLMLIDLERNDLGRICETGSIEVNELMGTEEYSHVIHIVSNIRGQLKAGATPDQILEALFPGGTITGVPKIRCMEIIRELEKTDRKAYTGSLGMIYANGSMDFNILIRSILIENTKLSCRFGAGIVADSNPQREYEETLHKAQAIFKVLGITMRELG